MKDTKQAITNIDLAALYCKMGIISYNIGMIAGKSDVHDILDIKPELDKLKQVMIETSALLDDIAKRLDAH